VGETDHEDPRSQRSVGQGSRERARGTIGYEPEEPTVRRIGRLDRRGAPGLLAVSRGGRNPQQVLAAESAQGVGAVMSGLFRAHVCPHRERPREPGVSEGVQAAVALSSGGFP